MILDTFAILSKFLVLFTYGISFLISLLFTTDINKYHELDRVLNSKILVQTAKVNPLDTNFQVIDEWLIANNRIIGPLICVLCLLDMFMLIRVIDLI